MLHFDTKPAPYFIQWIVKGFDQVQKPNPKA